MTWFIEDSTWKAFQGEHICMWKTKQLKALWLAQITRTNTEAKHSLWPGISFAASVCHPMMGMNSRRWQSAAFKLWNLALQTCFQQYSELACDTPQSLQVSQMCWNCNATYSWAWCRRWLAALQKKLYPFPGDSFELAKLAGAMHLWDKKDQCHRLQMRIQDRKVLLHLKFSWTTVSCEQKLQLF